MSDEHTPNSNAESLRDAIHVKAACGWGCFCDGCWLAATQAEKRHLTGHGTDALGAELAAYDALWRLSFGVDAGTAQPDPASGAPQAFPTGDVGPSST